MVAAVAPLLVEVDAETLEEGVGRLVAAGLGYWVRDAARGRMCPWEATQRERDAWWLIVRRPAGCPLVELAAQLGNVDEAQVWERLAEAVDELVTG